MRTRLLFWRVQLRSVSRDPHAKQLVILRENPLEVLQGLGVITEYGLFHGTCPVTPEEIYVLLHYRLLACSSSFSLAHAEIVWSPCMSSTFLSKATFVFKLTRQRPDFDFRRNTRSIITNKYSNRILFIADPLRRRTQPAHIEYRKQARTRLIVLLSRALSRRPL